MKILVTGAKGFVGKNLCEFFGGNKEDIKVIGIRHGKKSMKRFKPTESALTL